MTETLEYVLTRLIKFVMVDGSTYINFNPGYQVTWATKFCISAQYLWVFGMAVASYHTCGSQNFQVAPRFLK